MKIRVEAEFDLDMETAAKWFLQQSDDDMCKFLVMVAEKAHDWDVSPYGQWAAVGHHLKTCKCATEDAREMVAYWADKP